MKTLVTEIEFCEFLWFILFCIVFPQQVLVFSRDPQKWYTLSCFIRDLIQNKYQKEATSKVYLIIQKGKTRFTFLTYWLTLKNFWWGLFEKSWQTLYQKKREGKSLHISLFNGHIFPLCYIQLWTKDNEHFLFKSCCCCHPSLVLKSGSYCFSFSLFFKFSIILNNIYATHRGEE